MKRLFFILFTVFVTLSILSAQNNNNFVKPKVIYPEKFHVVASLKDLPQESPVICDYEERNPEMEKREYPFAETALPKGPDPVWQKEMGTSDAGKSPLVNFEGIHNVNAVIPPDAQGDVSDNFYFQVVNISYQIWNKEGNSLLGPNNLTSIWAGVGITSHISDPVVIYDEQADRWFISVFETTTFKTYIAVSTSGDPRGSWYTWVYNWAKKPDYAKYSVWNDGYYFAANSSGQDVGVFNRAGMIAGNSSPGFVTFDNSNRPSINFHCIMPLDNDGTFAPSGTPGQFITINDDAWGGSDQLWIYELDVDWSDPSSATFSRTQRLSVPSFDSNFGNDWNNITQRGTSQKLDANPTILMFRAQYRNFGSYQSIVCCHTVDVDDTDHAGIRWYELRKTSSSWYIYQKSTYAPDDDSRWMGSIAMNGNGDIALGYSVSSGSTYPSIKYTGRKAGDALNSMTIPEMSILNGTHSQTGSNRWGDYSMMSVDPEDDIGFWFTSEYTDGGNSWRTRIASFSFGSSDCYAAGGCDEFIQQVEIGSIDNTTTCTEYGDYRNMSTDIPLNSSDELTVTICNPYSGDDITVWVDWNRDGDFSDAEEEIGYASGVGPHTFTIAPPNGLTTGECVMRIRLSFAGSPPSSPCGVTADGEVEDYTINLTPKIANQWTGAFNSYWHNKNNWSLGHIPTDDENVILKATGYYPTYLGSYDEECNNLTINSGTSLDIKGNRLIVNGNISVYGALKATVDGGDIICHNNVVWNSGSTADFSASSFFSVYGNWDFKSNANVQLANGNVDFIGSKNSFIRSYESNCSFNNLKSYKTGTVWTIFSSFSTDDLHINGDIYINTGAYFGSNSEHQIILKGSLINEGNFDFTSGTLVFDGKYQSIMMNSSKGVFNNVKINPTGDVSMTGDIHIVGDLLIESGALDPNDHVIKIEGNWTNNVGDAGFVEGNGRVIFFDTITSPKGINVAGMNDRIKVQTAVENVLTPHKSKKHQYCSNEKFNILEVSKYKGGALRLDGSIVTCNSYDWTAGAVDVIKGTFTALDLVDNGIYGSFYTNPGGVINLHQDTESGSYVDLNGNLIFTGGGEINVYGGNSKSYWPWSSDASLKMNGGGVLDFHDQGIYIRDVSTPSFTWSIDNGTIRTAGKFECNNPNFKPASGTIELYGSLNTPLSISNGSTLFNVSINKSFKGSDKSISKPVYDTGSGEPPNDGTKSNTVLLSSDLNVTNDMTITSGSLDLNDHKVNINNNLNIYGTLVMTHDGDSVNVGTDNTDGIFWHSGSSDNITNGKICTRIWQFEDGTNAQLGTGNTAFVKTIINCNDADASFGNLTLLPVSKEDVKGKTNQPIRVTGNCLMKSGISWWLNTQILVEGSWEIENGASVVINSNAGSSYCDDFILDGSLSVNNNSSVEVYNSFDFGSSGSLEILGGSFIYDAPSSAGLLPINGTLNISEGLFECTHNNLSLNNFSNTITGGTIRVGGSFITGNTFHPTGGVVEFEISSSIGNYIKLNPGDYFNDLTLNMTGSVEIYSGTSLDIKGDFTINGGELKTNSLPITVGGDWNNNVGPDAFIEGTGKVTFDGGGGQNCTTEEFYTLVVDKPAGDLRILNGAKVTCQFLQWITTGNLGEMHVENGTFTAYDLFDDGIYGVYYLTDDEAVVNLYQDNDQYINLYADINIVEGEINIYGGKGYSFWPLNRDISLKMSGGTLNFEGNNGVFINGTSAYTLTTDITGGTIKVSGEFYGNGDEFKPVGGTVELYGLGESYVGFEGNSFFNNLLINLGTPKNNISALKTIYGDETMETRSQKAITYNSFLVKGALTVNEGELFLNGHTITVNQDVNINNGGTITVSNGAQLSISNGHALRINNGIKIEKNKETDNTFVVK
jgi:hypothetical protein